MKKSISTLYIAFLISSFSQAQTIEKAEKQYKNVAYTSTINTYSALGEPQSRTSLLQMANSYRLNGDYENAEYYYESLMGLDPEKEDVLHYAQVLLSNGKCEKAVSFYAQYQAKSKDAKRSFITSCDDLKAFSKKNIDIQELQGANTEFADFSAIPFKGGVVLTSTKKATNVCKDSWTGTAYSDLYYADVNENSINEIKPFGPELNMRYHDGTATFNRAGNVMYFSRTNPTGKNTNNQRDLKIFISHYKNGVWSDAVELPFNSDEFSNCHPTLSNDGKRLYFASNRDGGQGGMDLWLTRLENGRWSEPQNLGAEVNTSGNELFPFINEKEQLFFASNGHKGLGGLDIFSAENQNGIFSNIKNAGTPLNTSLDDFSYSEKSGGESGYISSNRKGGVGADDIYVWKKNANTPENQEDNDENKIVLAKIIYIDAENGAVLNNPFVTVSGPNVEPKMEQKNNFELPVVASGQYTLKGELAGYLPHTLTVEGIDLVKTPEYKIPLTKEKPAPIVVVSTPETPSFEGKTLKTGAVIELQDIYYDYNKANIRIDASAGLLRLAEVMITHPSLEVELSSHTDSRGKFDYNMDLSQRRASEAVAYLISRGISSKRMKARGYGEAMITNGCLDGKNCNEEEHQRNRRTEVRVLKFEEEGVKVIKN